MKPRARLVPVVFGALCFAVGLVLQFTGRPDLGLAVSMIGVIIVIVGGLFRPGRTR
jgi:hypothetical protein